MLLFVFFLPGKNQVVNQEVYNIFARSCCCCEKKDEWRAAFFAMYTSIKMYADFINNNKEY
jgi:hypothetical protein